MNEFPVTVKRSIELLGLVLIGFIIVAGKAIIMPLLLAFFISLTMLPILRLFKPTKVPEPVAIVVCVVLMAVMLALLSWLFYSQLAFLADDYTQIKNNLSKHLDDVSRWINETFGYSASQQSQFLKDQADTFLKSPGTYLAVTAGSISGVLLFLGLLPVYIYFILFYRRILLKFILMWVKPNAEANARDVIHKVEHVINRYLVGLLIQIGYLVLLLWLSLFLFGIKNALLIAILFAFLNLIPYIGALVGNILGILITLATSANISDIVIVLAVIAVVQFLDNNILMPKIVGGQVKINALVSLLGLLAAGMLAGITGMFLAMPIMAVLKIIFSHTSKFKKWAVLLGVNSQ